MKQKLVTAKTKCPEADDPEQSRRFMEAARNAEAAETEEEADRAFRKVAGPASPSGNERPG